MTPEDKKALWEFVGNENFQRIFTLFVAEEKAKLLDYMQACIRHSPINMEEVVRAEAAATVFGDMLKAMVSATK